MINKILSPTDFSENARNASNSAALLTQKCGGQLVLFHAYHLASAETTMMIDVSDILKQKAQEKLEEEKARLLSKFDIDIVLDSEYGPMVPLIQKKVKEFDAQLIVMGTKGATSSVKRYFGSNTTRLIQEVQIPVLAIPEDYDIATADKLVFAWDQSHLDDELKSSIHWISRTLDLGIDAVQVIDKAQSGDEYALKTFAQSIAEDSDYHLINGKNVIDRLQEYSLANSGILGLMAQKHSPIYNLLNKSISTALAHNASQPLFILKQA